MHCTVLAVDRHDGSPRRGSQRLHDGTSSNEAFFVGERQAFATAQRFERDRETSKTHHGVYHDIGISDDVGDHVNKLDTRELASQFSANMLVNDGDNARLMLRYLGTEHGLVGRCGESNDFISTM